MVKDRVPNSSPVLSSTYRSFWGVLADHDEVERLNGAGTVAINRHQSDAKSKTTAKLISNGSCLEIISYTIDLC